MPIQPSDFFEAGKVIFRGRRKVTRHQRALHKDMDMFRSFFGTWPCICSALWDSVDPIDTIHPKSKPHHLLWALLLMTCYSREAFHATLAGVDEDTFRKWAMPWIPKISLLSCELIDFDMRFEGKWHYWSFCVDGIHCPINEPRRPFWEGWFSHKFRGPGLAYEVATAVTTGKIIWINGPFPAGQPDHKIFKKDLAKLVRTDIEKGVCDAGYKYCEQWLFRPFWRTYKALKEGVPRNDLHEYIRARHEQTNSRFHKFNCLASKFRHNRRLHHHFFHAVAVIVQLEIIHGLAEQFSIIPRPWVEPDQYEPIPDVEEEYPWPFDED